ncbi:SMC-Scp complex subunit ScpB [Rhodococcus sp. NPDC056516]|uniref:SMC-Scp complex subunit ScpB n=1 Tax=Rhodococcus sp. NPDC056516 TaxID=3345847 RepID=UPI003670DDD6
MNAEPTESESSQLDEMIEPADDAAVSEDSAPDFDLDDDQLDAVLESLLLVVDSPAEVNQLASVTGTAPERVEQRLTLMSAALTARGSGMDLRNAGDGWRLYTRQEFAPYVEKLLLDGARTKLTRAALETLAVVAYRQPLTRARISAVRGVNVDGVVRTLLARGLIAEAGPDPDTNATRYSTTELFLERLGLASLSELPELAPLLPDVDLIDDISESLESDPRFARMNKADVPADVVDTEVDD